MAKSIIRRLAESWSPRPDDDFGEDKRELIRYLLDVKATASSPVSIATVLKEANFSISYRREGFQHQILGPLRRDPNVFVGTCSAGIFLVLSPEDADATLGFYTWRVRAELRHARNLRGLAKRAKLMVGYRTKLAAKKDRATIYLDESGSPDLKNLTPRFFVVAAVIIGSRQDLSGLDLRFKHAFSSIGRPQDHELKTVGLSVSKHARVLRELSLLEYQWAAAAFDKKRLTGAGFSDPATFYRYALQFLVGDLLMTAWQADLVIDESSTPRFQAQLEHYLRRQNSGLPIGKLNSIKFSDSSKTRLVQLADLVAGAVRRSVDGDKEPLREIEHQMINLQFWPPR